MKLEKITDCVNKASICPVWTLSFLAGYRAFVYGGKKRKYAKNGKLIKSYGGYNPPDELTDKQKSEWKAGVMYAKKERIDCRSIKFKSLN